MNNAINRVMHTNNLCGEVWQTEHKGTIHQYALRAQI